MTHMNNPFSLEGKNAWITGASYGIGFNIAKAFVAAGINIHKAQETVEDQNMVTGRYVAIWEHASDQTYEPEDGMLGVAVTMSGADFTGETGDGTHLVLARSVASGEPFRYRFGSCWSKGDIQTEKAWFDLVDKQ